MIGLRTAIVPLALSLGAAEAFQPGFAWHPARETDGNLAKIDAVVPLATAAPEPKHLFKRGTATCGYIEGDPLQAVTCRADLGAECLYDSRASAIGCCATTSCDIWTACIPRTDSSRTLTADMDRTRYCSNAASPHCAVYLWKDPTWTGYTMAICDSVSTTYSFYPSPLAAVDDTTTTPPRRSSSSTTISSSSSTSPFRTTSTTPSDNGGGTPVGAIVGGVIGGIAVLVLLGVGLFFILRRKRQNNNVPPVAPQPMVAAPPGPGQAPPYYSPDPNMNNQMYAGAPSNVPSMYGPPPGQMPPMGPDGTTPPGGFYYAPPPQDNRVSMATTTPISPTSYSPSIAVTPLANQPGGHPGQSPIPAAREFNSPDQAFAAQNAQFQPPQQQPSPVPYNPQTPPVVQAYVPPTVQGGYPKQGGVAPVELPTTRPDGELRELP